MGHKPVIYPSIVVQYLSYYVPASSASPWTWVIIKILYSYWGITILYVGKFWQIWWISGDPPNFYPPNIQFDKSVLCNYWYPFYKNGDNCTSLHNCDGGSLVIHHHRQYPKCFGKYDMLTPWLVQRTRDPSSNFDSCDKHVGKFQQN